MSVTQLGRSKNSTIDRFIMNTLSWVSPGAVERRAVEAFATPLPLEGSPAEPRVPGLEAHRFSVDAEPYRLTAWDWGGGELGPGAWGRRPTVLLVHGWNGRAAQLSRFVAPLVEAGFYVVAFDQPAHGASSGSRATLLDLTRAVRAVARKVGPLHGVIAHSLGATATALAIERGMQVDRAVLLAPPAEVEHFVRGFAARLGLPAARADGMLERIRHEVGGELERLDLRRLARNLRVPLLLMHDPQDREVPFQHGAAIAQAWPGARIEVLRGLGHRRLLADANVIDHAVAFLGDTEDQRFERRSA
jgi:pimeloyl-ACP methyl ester carboxylesterase